MPMILHYLKVAARSLMKYKMQSLISALCLAVGIVCFSYTYRFVETVAPTDYRPHYDRRLNLSLANNGALSSPTKSPVWRKNSVMPAWKTWRPIPKDYIRRK